MAHKLTEEWTIDDKVVCICNEMWEDKRIITRLQDLSEMGYHYTYTRNGLHDKLVIELK